MKLNLIKVVISDAFKLDDSDKLLLDTKMVKLLNHYVLFYLRQVDLLFILKTTKKHVIFS